MIRLEGLGKRYPGRDGEWLDILKEVDLHIPSGAYTALVGPSGSGKSTLMHILGCLDVPTSGRYLLDGEDVSQLDARALCRLRREKVGFIFQGYQLMSKLTAEENAAFPLLLRGMGEQDRLRMARRALSQVGLAGREHHRPCELSGGQQQRVAIARALCAQPKVLLCDEPTGALDETSRNDVLDLLDELHLSGVTIVTITHDPFVAARAAQRFRVQGGRIISQGLGAYPS